MNKDLKSACKIGTFCITTYLASYIARNILSVSTPAMIVESFFTKEYIGMLSSVCFIFYAIGQLINGFIGDMVSPKYMIVMGLGLSGMSILSVPIFENRTLHYAAFAVIGFGLSMLRGPLTKIISENTVPKHARMLCTLFNMASFAGPFVASLLSVIFKWRTVFAVTGAFVLLTTVMSFALINILERRGEIIFTFNKPKGIGGIFDVFKLKNFIFYMIISGIGEVAGSSITFWIPTYSIEHLAFSSRAASTIYSIVSFSSLLSPFISLFIYEKIIKDDTKIILFMYGLSAVLFAAVRIITDPVTNIIMLVLAKTAASSAVCVVWSVYIPGLAKSGKVSSANGVLDAAGYGMASLASMLFSGSISKFGWGVTVSLWCAVLFLGAAVSGIKFISEKRSKI